MKDMTMGMKKITMKIILISLVMFSITEIVLAQSANISGSAFNDLDNSGTKDVGEPGLANWTIELITPGNESPISIQTESNGNYTFTGLSAGNYTVREGLQLGWIRTLPVGGTYNITINGADITDLDFGNSENHSVIVLFDQNTTQNEKQNAIASVNGTIIQSFTIIPGIEALIPVGNGTSPSPVDKLRQNPLVLGVDVDVWFSTQDTQADSQIHADQVWNYGFTGAGVRLAILDTGIDEFNNEFIGRVVACSKEVLRAPDCLDHNGHGTHVAGIAGAQGINLGAKGVAPSVLLMSDKVLNRWGFGTEAQFIAGVQWAMNNGAKIISSSFGTPLFHEALNLNCDANYVAMKAVIDAAVLKGITFVASAGDDGILGVQAPACISSAIAVGAVDSFDILAIFSGVGLPMNDHGMVAPGVNIFSTLPGGNYGRMSGSSMAASFVSGSIALMLTKNPMLTPADIRYILFKSADCVAGPCPNNNIGFGRINVLNAIAIVSPVLQNIGIYDTSIDFLRTDQLDQSTCRNCHNGGVPTRHHLLVQRVITNPFTNIPFQCTDCHPQLPGGGVSLDRSCQDCHNGLNWFGNQNGGKVGGFARPHHVKSDYASTNIGNPASNRDCKFCHGSFVENFNDKHYKPTYDTDFMITPYATFKVTDRIRPNGIGGRKVWGGCFSCHLSAPEAKPIGSNHDNHHKEILGFVDFGGQQFQNTPTPNVQCYWCHVIDPANGNPKIDNGIVNPNNNEVLNNVMEFRDSTIEKGDQIEFASPNGDITKGGTGCEKCHSVSSLHNIQFGFVQNGPQGFGHINNNYDCSGCHNSWPANNFVPGAIIPSVDSVNPSLMIAGNPTTLTINGSNFVNDNYTSVITIDGVTYTPSSITDTKIVVNIPALTAGVYKLQLVKDDKLSKLETLIVVTNTTITSAKLNSKTGIITITGTGFGTKPVIDAQLYVSVNHTGNQIFSTDIPTWNNNQIRAKNSVATIGDVVTVITANSGDVQKVITN